ncbi:MAG TPA: MFS transporter [Candidatus Limnocylindrales bacterium]
MTDVDAGARPLGRAARVPLLAPLGIRDYRFVWLGESISLLGDQFNTVALAWLVLGQTGSGFALGAILIAAAIPRGVFLLFGGVLSDRISPRDLALASNVLRAILTTVVAALVIGERVELWHLAAVGVVFGTVDAVFLPAINTLVPRLVPSERLAAANAMLQGTGQLVGTIGPAVAGFAVALVGVGAAFAVDAASFAVAALMLWFVRSGATPGHGSDDAAALAEAPVDQGSQPHAASIRASLVEGGRVVLGDPVMRSIVVLSTAANLAFTGATVVGLPWLVLVRFGADAAALGLLFAAFGAGSLVGVIAAGSLPQPRRFGSIVLGFVLIMGIGLAAIGLAPTLPVAGVILFGIGAMNGWVNIVVIAWVQGKTDPVMLGRTMSFLMLGSVVAAPLSLALAALIVDTDATALFLAAGLLVVASAAVALASGLQRRMV